MTEQDEPAPRLWIDPSTPMPPYEQIRAQVTTLVAGGWLAPGARLPSVRQLAADLGLAAGTVARAYRELEAAGLVESRRRTGTHVVQRQMQTAPTEPLTQLAAKFVDEARKLPATADEILAAVARKLREQD